MKLKLLVFGLMLPLVSLFGDSTKYDVSVTYTAAPFQYVVIGATTDSSYVPWNNGLYIGFTGADDYVKVGTMVGTSADTTLSRPVTMDLTGLEEGYYFFMELRAANAEGTGYDMIAYTGWTSYSDVANAMQSLKTTEVEGMNYAVLTNGKTYAVPEPTSGLLLLVGGALLGLRRKRRVA